MACACRGRAKTEFLWIPEDGSVDGENTIIYYTEVEAKAKVMRAGGSYYTREEFAQLAVQRSVERNRIQRVQRV